MLEHHKKQSVGGVSGTATASVVMRTYSQQQQYQYQKQQQQRATLQGTIFICLMTTGFLFWFIDIVYLMTFLVDHTAIRHEEEEILQRGITFIKNQRNRLPPLSFHSIRNNNGVEDEMTMTDDAPEMPDQDDDNTANNKEGEEEEEEEEEQEQVEEEMDYETMIAGKGPILDLLRDAGMLDDIDNATIRQLPTWDEVTDLYGKEPIYYGLDTCQEFQYNTGDPAEHFVSTAGTFNTGTNLMAELLINNCHMPLRMKKYGARSRGVRWQVQWGKHTPIRDEGFRQQHKTYNETSLTADNMFPAVMIRDPYKWMQSMCRHEYGASWDHDSTHCPNLIPNHYDRNTYPALRDALTVPVTVTYSDFEYHHSSLLDFYNDWYRDYMNVNWPRLIVRYEDVLYRPKQVTKTVCECSGGQLDIHHPFRYIVQSAKHGTIHGTDSEKTSYVSALIKYGTEKGRYDGYTNEDLQYIKRHVNSNIMDQFHYKYAPKELLLKHENGNDGGGTSSSTTSTRQQQQQQYHIDNGQEIMSALKEYNNHNKHNNNRNHNNNNNVGINQQQHNNNYNEFLIQNNYKQNEEEEKNEEEEEETKKKKKHHHHHHHKHHKHNNNNKDTTSAY